MNLITKKMKNEKRKEKKGRGSQSLTFLFLLFSFFFCCIPIYAQEPGMPRVLILKAPDRPVEGSTLTLTMLVDHGNPDEVNVMAPPFTDGLFLDYMLKGPRLANPAEDDNLTLWTAIEFRFALTGHGTIEFEPFTIITPHGQTQTYPFNIVVQRAPGAAGIGETTRFRLSWENVPTGLKIGENAVISLRVNGWKNTFVRPESGLFLPPVPPGHIIESLPLSEKEKQGGIALKLRIIPLENGLLTLGNRRLTIENAIYEVPGLRIQVSRDK
jgi:hypothetical protein